MKAIQMPIFSRRRIQSMLSDLSRDLKSSHFIGRLNDKRYENAIPAEAELGLVWAVSKLGEFEPEPDWFSDRGRKPEGISDFIVPNHQTVFDVKAISDRIVPGNIGMKKISRKFMEEANKIKRRSGNSLDFFFWENQDYRVAKKHRTILAPPLYNPSNDATETLKLFLESMPEKGEYIDIHEPGLSVRISWNPDAHPKFNHRSSIVNEIFDIDDNHIVNALKEKASQLRSENFEGLRGVLLADIGCETLRRFDGIDPLGRSQSGRKIITHYLDNCGEKLDFVCVFSPQSERDMYSRSKHYWTVSLCTRRGLDLETDGLEKLAAHLPIPRFEGYALEELHEQNLFGPQSQGWYLACDMSIKNHELTIKFSARALHEFLAGRINEEQFKARAVRSEGAFEYQLKTGNTIKSTEIVPGGIDEDDDYIQLHFEKDPAASPFE